MQPELPLRDVLRPAAISWWPPAIGWWILAILIPLLLGFAIWLYKRLTRKTAVKTARKLLANIKEDSKLDQHQKLCELSALLRRVAITVSPRAKVAALTGRDWLAYLDSSLKNAPFSDGIGQLLMDAPYRKVQPTEQEISQLISLCEGWLQAQTKQARKQKS